MAEIDWTKTTPRQVAERIAAKCCSTSNDNTWWLEEVVEEIEEAITSYGMRQAGWSTGRSVDEEGRVTSSWYEKME